MSTADKKRAEQRERHILRIMSTCVHFTGIQNQECKASVNYHKQFGTEPGCFANIPCTHWPEENPKECLFVKYPTRDEAEAEENEREAMSARFMGSGRF